MRREIDDLKIGFSWKNFAPYLIGFLLVGTIFPFFIYKMGERHGKLGLAGAFTVFAINALIFLFKTARSLYEVFQSIYYVPVEAFVIENLEDKVYGLSEEFSLKHRSFFFPVLNFSLNGVEHMVKAHRVRRDSPFIIKSKLIILVDPRDPRSCFALSHSEFLDRKT